MINSNQKNNGTPKGFADSLKKLKGLEKKFKAFNPVLGGTKTNGQRLNSMTPEEKAEFLTSTENCQHCSFYGECTTESKADYSCFDGTLEWINAPWDNGENK